MRSTHPSGIRFRTSRLSPQKMRCVSSEVESRSRATALVGVVFLVERATGRVRGSGVSGVRAESPPSKTQQPKPGTGGIQARTDINSTVRYSDIRIISSAHPYTRALPGCREPANRDGTGYGG